LVLLLPLYFGNVRLCFCTLMLASGGPIHKLSTRVAAIVAVLARVAGGLMPGQRKQVELLEAARINILASNFDLFDGG